MSKRLLVFILIVLVLIIILYKGFSGLFSTAPKRTLPPSPVEVAKAQKQMWKNQIMATGDISALNGVMLKSQVPGQITQIYFVSGTFVEKGAPLFQIYPYILQAELEANEASLDLARVNYDRSVQLYKKNVISKQTLDEQTAKLKSAMATVERTQAQLAQNNITAPFSGKIGLKQVDVGSYVNAGEALVPLQEMNPLKVQFSVADNYITQVALGNEVDIQVSGDTSRIYKGSVYALNSAVDPQTRMISMWAKIPNPDLSLVPGTYVFITLYTGTPQPKITVPQTSVVYSPQGAYVYKIVNNTAIKTQVKPGLRQGNDMAIEGDVKPGDVIVTTGQIKLFDNTPVKIMPTSTYPAGQASTVKIITFDTPTNYKGKITNPAEAPGANATPTNKLNTPASKQPSNQNDVAIMQQNEAAIASATIKTEQNKTSTVNANANTIKPNQTNTTVTAMKPEGKPDSDSKNNMQNEVSSEPALKSQCQTPSEEDTTCAANNLKNKLAEATQAQPIGASTPVTSQNVNVTEKEKN